MLAAAAAASAAAAVGTREALLRLPRSFLRTCSSSSSGSGVRKSCGAPRMHSRAFSSSSSSVGSSPWSHIGRSSSRSRWVVRVDRLIARTRQKAEAAAAASEEGFAAAGLHAAAAASFAAAAAAELEGERPVPPECVHPDLRPIAPAWNSRRSFFAAAVAAVGGAAAAVDVNGETELLLRRLSRCVAASLYLFSLGAAAPLCLPLFCLLLPLRSSAFVSLSASVSFSLFLSAARCTVCPFLSFLPSPLLAFSLPLFCFLSLSPFFLFLFSALCLPLSAWCGVLAYKVGMMSLWDSWGERHPVTVCQIDRCLVLQQKTLATHGYEACVLGLGYRSPLRVSRANMGRFVSLGMEPKAATAEFKVSSDCLLPVGLELSALHFVAGQWCFVTGWSQAKGFQGPVKRWGFKASMITMLFGNVEAAAAAAALGAAASSVDCGNAAISAAAAAGQNASHGTESKAHRSHGSIGQSKTVNVVWRFKKMAGHVGPDPRVVNCQVLRIQRDRNLLFLKGCVPGGVGSVLKISDARGKTHHQKNRHVSLPFPTFVPQQHKAYPLLLEREDGSRDPFAYPEIPIYDKEGA
ncbi:hypothetical protein Esti_004029 [Eimeria stiedai]